MKNSAEPYRDRSVTLFLSAKEVSVRLGRCDRWVRDHTLMFLESGGTDPEGLPGFLLGGQYAYVWEEVLEWVRQQQGKREKRRKKRMNRAVSANGA